jgi:cytochrome c553
MAAEMHDLTPEQAAAHDRAFRRGAVVVVGAILLVGLVLGFLILPAVQAPSEGLGVWSAICRAVGIPAGSPAPRQLVTTAAVYPVSEVSWGPTTLDLLSRANAAHGAEVAGTCTACHGTQGFSPDPQFPNISGQSAYAIYKQMQDYRTGARVNDAMAAVVRYLGDRSVADVAVYYASHEMLQQIGSGDEATVNLARRGDPSRGIASCNACHLGNRDNTPIESPNLVGQHQAYLANQLQAFAAGTRKNDVYARMRVIAGSLTSNEIVRLAAYYSSADRR